MKHRYLTNGKKFRVQFKYFFWPFWWDVRDSFGRGEYEVSYPREFNSLDEAKKFVAREYESRERISRWRVVK